MFEKEVKKRKNKQTQGGKKKPSKGGNKTIEKKQHRTEQLLWKKRLAEDAPFGAQAEFGGAKGDGPWVVSISRGQMDKTWRIIWDD